MVTSAFDLIIFDLDGVLVDSELLSCGCLAEALTRHGVTIGVAEVMERFLGRSFSEVAAFYAERMGTPIGEGFRAEQRARLEARFTTSLKPMPHAAELLAGLSIPFCLASSSDPDRIRMTLGLVGFGAFFGERVFSSAMVARGKPAPDLFRLAAERLGAAPQRTLVVEDSPSGVAAGVAAGMTVWGFVGGSHYCGRDGRAILREAGAHRIIGSLAAEFVAEPTGVLTA